MPPKKKYEKTIQYDIPLFSQGTYSLCWAYCQTMAASAHYGLGFTQDQADEFAIFLAKIVNGEAEWNKGALPVNIGDKYYVDTIAELYTLLNDYGPLYALYFDARAESKTSHMVLITGVNITTNTVYTNNPWGPPAGKQTFDEFLTGIAWDNPISYDFRLSCVYSIRR